jgi:hypothetical protein
MTLKPDRPTRELLIKHNSMPNDDEVWKKFCNFEHGFLYTSRNNPFAATRIKTNINAFQMELRTTYIRRTKGS